MWCLLVFFFLIPICNGYNLLKSGLKPLTQEKFSSIIYLNTSAFVSFSFPGIPDFKLGFLSLIFPSWLPFVFLPFVMNAHQE